MTANSFAAWHIARLSVVEGLRSRMLWIAVFTALAAMLLGCISVNLSVFEHARLVIDFGLAAASLMGTSIAIAYGLSWIGHVHSSSSAALWLARPIRRSSYLLGRFLGLWFLLVLSAGLVVGATAACLLLLRLQLPAGLFAATVAIAVELAVVQSVVFVLGVCCSKPLAASLSVAVWLAGNVADEIRLLGERQPPGLAQGVCRIAYALLPDMSRISLRDFAGANQALPPGVWLHASIYGMGYAVAALAVACYIYERRREL